MQGSSRSGGTVQKCSGDQFGTQSDSSDNVYSGFGSDDTKSYEGSKVLTVTDLPPERKGTSGDEKVCGGTPNITKEKEMKYLVALIVFCVGFLISPRVFESVHSKTYSSILDPLQELQNCLPDKISFTRVDGKLPLNVKLWSHHADLPKAVIMPTSTEEIAQAVQCLYRQPSLPKCVKSGGHDMSGLSSCLGVMVDVSQHKWLKPEGELLHVATGANLGKVVYELWQMNRSLPHGDSMEVGIGGHATQGGWDVVVGRRDGLLTQNILGGRVVLWNGTVLSFNETINPDLLWATRGGAAANVGIVSELTFHTQERPSQVCIAITYMPKEEMVATLTHTFVNGLALPREYSFTLQETYEWKSTRLRAFSLHDCERSRRELSAVIPAFAEARYESMDLMEARLQAGTMMPVVRQNLSMIKLDTWELQDRAWEIYDPEFLMFETLHAHSVQRAFYVDPSCPELSKLVGLAQQLQGTGAYPYNHFVLGGGEMLSRDTSTSMIVEPLLARAACQWHQNNDSLAELCSAWMDHWQNTVMPCTTGHVYRADAWVTKNPFGMKGYYGQEIYEKLHAIKCKYDPHTTMPAHKHKMACRASEQRNNELLWKNE
ncbi:hypothetical protein QOT17_024415 [Balamuthia mandrillaris]